MAPEEVLNFSPNPNSNLPPPLFGANGSNGNDSWRKKTLGSMVYGLSVAASAIVVTAGYNIATEEGRGLINRLRSTRALRKERNDAVLCAMLATELPVEVIRHIEGQRDAFRAAIALTLDEDVDKEIRRQLRACLRELYDTSAARTHTP